MLDILHPGHSDRYQAEAFIHEVFAKKYNADISVFMPHLIRLRYDETGACYSVAGYKEAVSGELFVEQYLRQSVDYELSRKIGQRVNRDVIVEVGNLAEAGPGGGRDAIIALVSFLFGAGYQWGVVTAVPQLANGFRRLKVRWHIQRARNHALSYFDQMRSESVIAQNDYAAMAGAMSQLLAQLSEKMAKAVMNLPFQAPPAQTE